VAVSKRSAFLDPLSDFIRDVAFYIKRGAAVRDFIADEVRSVETDSPVVILGHSLGGIAAVDLLSDPALMQGDVPLRVDLLVTVGSQSPFLYLLDSLNSLSPRTPSQQPFVPWLNIYNRQDLLSFCASRVFVNSPGIVDEPVSAGVPFRCPTARTGHRIVSTSSSAPASRHEGRGDDVGVGRRHRYLRPRQGTDRGGA
jgi:hypothetical protein